MKIFGIDFVSPNTPLQEHLEVVSAGIILVLIMGLVPLGFFGTVYVLFCTKYWALVLLYFIWICVVDKDVPERGGRINEWVRSWRIFTYAQNYFPITLEAVPNFNIDPKQNYISCAFPHGIMPIGIILSFLTNACKETKRLFSHKMHGLTLKNNFFIPIYREFLLAIGMCSASPESIKWILNQPGGGHVAGLIVGGAAESFYSEPGKYKIVLKNRKGFVKLALRNGVSIIPTFAFGQNDIFKQLKFKDNGIAQRVQNWIKRVTGIAPVIFFGRGLLQKTFGYIPLQTPINIVVGNPIEVKKIQNPTQEDIDGVHSVFIQKLTELFEQYKYKYEKDPESSTLIVC